MVHLAIQLNPMAASRAFHHANSANRKSQILHAPHPDKPTTTNKQFAKPNKPMIQRQQKCHILQGSSSQQSKIHDRASHHGIHPNEQIKQSTDILYTLSISVAPPSQHKSIICEPGQQQNPLSYPALSCDKATEP